MVRRGEDARGDARDIADCARSRSQSIQTIFYFCRPPPPAAGRSPVRLSRYTASQSVSYFTVPPRAHPSTSSQSGSAAPGLTQVPSTRSRGLLNYRK